MIEGDDLLKAKIKNMLIANAGGFYNISRSIATPKLNEITNYLVDAIGYLGKASKQSGSENINRSEAYRELATKINDRVSGKVQSFEGMETPLSEFIAQTKADVLGASLSKFANQDHASQRLYEVLRDMPEVLEKKFAEPSFDFFGDAEVKALKDVDMYDFLDYMIGRGQQNQATSELKDALIGLKKLESSQPNPPSPNNPSTPPTKASPQASTTKTNAQASTTRANANNAGQVAKEIYTLRQKTKAHLEPIINQKITNQNDGREAIISNKNINKMISNKAIQKSLDNGFSTQEHFKAVDDIQALYQKSQWKETTDDKNGEKYLKIHRYEADIDEAKQAKITLKENIENGSRIYTLELEAVAPKIPQRSEAKGEQIAMSRKPEPAHPDTPIADSNTNFTTPTHKSTQNNPQTKLETTYFQRENLKREIDELEKEYFWQRRMADGSILPSKIDALSENKRQKLDYKRNELIEKAKALTDEIMQNHKILKTLKELNTDEQINEAVLRNLINPSQTETPIKVIYKDIQKSGDEAMFINKQRAAAYHDTAKNETKNNTLLRVARKKLEKAFNIEPIKEFGTNYAEFYQDGKGAIAKLIAEANAAKQAGQDFSGQVAGAFSKEIDGAPARIDLVWGNEKMGLEKILQKHLDDFSDFSGGNPHEKVANGLSEIITQGEASKTHNGYNIKFNDFIVGINKGWNENGVKTGDNKWIVTAFDNSKEISKKATAANFTEGAAQPNNLTDEIITKIQEKMKVSKEYAKNLAKWHKDSHPLTKEADGTPKVFYHGNGDNDVSFEIFKPRTRLADMNTPASFFSADKNTAKTYIVNSDYPPQVFEVFLNVKNPLIIDFKGKPYREKGDIVDEILKGEKYFNEAVDKVLKTGKYDGVIYKNVKDNLSGQGETISDTIAVFSSNQIKEVGNKGTFDATNPNIYHSSSTAGGGVLGGTIAGVEKDDEGNAVGFSPEKFALGFAAGAGGAKALSSNFAKKYAKNIDIIADKKLKQGNKMENQKLKTRLDKAKTQNEIIDLPTQSFKNIKEFNKLFDSQNGAMGTIKTPYKNMQVRIPYAYRHFYQNTNNKNRDGIKSAFFETFRNPLFITKEKRGGKDSIYFYKPFYDKDKNIINLFGIGVDSKNKVDFKTFYLDEIETRIKQVLKVSDENVLYIKK